MKTIIIKSLKHGDQIIFVDNEDYDKLIQFNWFVSKHSNDKGLYAIRNTLKREGLGITTLKMHRIIMGINDPKIFVDHINHNTLDNRKENLRLANPAESMCNIRSRDGSTSKYRGVHFFKRDGNWQAQIRSNGKSKHIGYFNTEEEAAIAYDEFAKEIHGKFAKLNFK